MTPNVAIVHVNRPHGPNFKLWLPVFLLWTPAILLAPLMVIVLMIVCLSVRIPFWRSIAAFWALMCSLPGTDVRVATEGNRVLVRIF